MALQLADKWVWDFWLARDGADHHIFYLQAPKSLGDERQRHWHVSIGHAVSRDLVNWTVLPDALAPSRSDSGQWDDYTTWTGSVIRHQGQWYLFYTGSCRAERGLVQRIGVATSADLITWRKHPANPLLEVDTRWYEKLDAGLWHDEAWRDPWVFAHGGRFHMYITARGLNGEPSGRGVIGHATSADLIQWTCLPPVAHPGEFGHMEVPQLAEIEGRWYLFFCVGYGQFAAARRARPASADVIGTHYLVGPSPLGPFEMIEDEFLLADLAGSRYAGKAVQDPSGRWCFLTSRAWTGDGGFIGEIDDPIPLRVLPDGRLRVAGGEDEE